MLAKFSSVKEFGLLDQRPGKLRAVTSTLGLMQSDYSYVISQRIVIDIPKLFVLSQLSVDENARSSKTGRDEL